MVASQPAGPGLFGAQRSRTLPAADGREVAPASLRFRRSRNIDPDLALDVSPADFVEWRRAPLENHSGNSRRADALQFRVERSPNAAIDDRRSMLHAMGEVRISRGVRPRSFARKRGVLVSIKRRPQKMRRPSAEFRRSETGRKGRRRTIVPRELDCTWRHACGEHCANECSRVTKL